MRASVTYFLVFMCEFAAFRVSKDEPRLILREITDGSSFLMRGTFILNMSLSDHNATLKPDFIDELLINITTSITNGLQHVLALTRDGSVFAAPSEILVYEKNDERVYEGSALFIALNSSGPTMQSWNDAWYNITINSIHAMATHWAIKDIVSRSTFKARATSLYIICLDALSFFSLIAAHLW